jgi:hypothetical protein
MSKKHTKMLLEEYYNSLKNGVFWDVRHVALVRTDISEDLCASIIRMARIRELGTMLAVTSNQRMLRRMRLLTLYFFVVFIGC